MCADLQIFSAREKLQLDVYGLLAVLRNQLKTDDSFVLNRILGRVKESIQKLPEADESDDQVLKEFEVCLQSLLRNMTILPKEKPAIGFQY